MPDKSGRLTHQEQTFVQRFAATGDAREAAQAAGYKSRASEHQLTLRPQIMAEIGRVQAERLMIEGLPAAVECLIGLVRNSHAPAGARVRASEVIIHRTIGDKSDGREKEPHEMTAEDIAKRLDELERLAASRAKPVEDVAAQPGPSALD